MAEKILPQTASQTAGPYVHIGLAPKVAGFEMYDQPLGEVIAGLDVPGERIRVGGMIRDAEGEPVRDALIEIWQANAQGAYPDRDAVSKTGFWGWGRASTHFETGLWQVETIRPGQVAGHNGTLQAPHLSLWIVARGINSGLHTRIYFNDLGDLNQQDPLLSTLSAVGRHNTLLATDEGEADGVRVFRFDICLKGDGETVFLDL